MQGFPGFCEEFILEFDDVEINVHLLLHALVIKIINFNIPSIKLFQLWGPVLSSFWFRVFRDFADDFFHIHFFLLEFLVNQHSLQHPLDLLIALE